MSNQDSQDELERIADGLEYGINDVYDYHRATSISADVDKIMEAINAHTHKAVTEAVDKTHYTLLERFNKGDEDAGRDIYINVDSDSWHVLIKQIKATLTKGTNS